MRQSLIDACHSIPERQAAVRLTKGTEDFVIYRRGIDVGGFDRGEISAVDGQRDPERCQRMPQHLGEPELPISGKVFFGCVQAIMVLDSINAGWVVCAFQILWRDVDQPEEEGTVFFRKGRGILQQDSGRLLKGKTERLLLSPGKDPKERKQNLPHQNGDDKNRHERTAENPEFSPAAGNRRQQRQIGKQRNVHALFVQQGNPRGEEKQKKQVFSGNGFLFQRLSDHLRILQIKQYKYQGKQRVLDHGDAEERDDRRAAEEKGKQRKRLRNAQTIHAAYGIAKQKGQTACLKKRIEKNPGIGMPRCGSDAVKKGEDQGCHDGMMVIHQGTDGFLPGLPGKGERIHPGYEIQDLVHGIVSAGSGAVNIEIAKVNQEQQRGQQKHVLPGKGQKPMPAACGHGPFQEKKALFREKQQQQKQNGIQKRFSKKAACRQFGVGIGEVGQGKKGRQNRENNPLQDTVSLIHKQSSLLRQNMP